MFTYRLKGNIILNLHIFVSLLQQNILKKRAVKLFFSIQGQILPHLMRYPVLHYFFLLSLL